VLTEQKFDRIDPVPVYRLVYDSIQRQILSGQLRNGDLLPTETRLAEQFGVNRSSVREGIRILEQSGFVERKAGKRLQVALPHFVDVASGVSRAMRLHKVTFRELWEGSLAIEPVVTRYAAERITSDEIAELRRNIEQMEKASSVGRVVELDIDFHNLLAQAARNRALILAREPISLLFMPAGRAILPKLKTQQRIIDAHHAILAAIERRDIAEAESWMSRHIQDFRRGYERTGLDMDRPLANT
jgi:GntR family transcriptional regulator, transcriptional repressor for pyruvate dehydrogenase complex